MAEFQVYRTLDGDRWDTLAYQFYGDPTAYEQIMVANPGVAISQVLSSGLELLIPVIEATDTLTTEDLPPWKR